jgi:hypothetical protein
MVVEVGSIGFPTSSLVSCMSKQLKGTTDSVRDGPDNTPLEKQRSHPTMCANPPGTGHEDAHEGANVTRAGCSNSHKRKSSEDEISTA